MTINILFIILGLAGFSGGIVGGLVLWTIYSTISELIKLWPRRM